MDRSNIPAGADFRQAAVEQIANSDILLVLIGTRWLAERLNNPADYVREEIETALEKKVRVIPVLVRGARMPDAGELPPGIQPLAGLKAFKLSDEQKTRDMRALASLMERRSWWPGVIAVLCALALAGGYVLRQPVSTVVKAGTPADSTSASTGRPGGTSPATPPSGVAPDSVLVDTALPGPRPTPPARPAPPPAAPPAPPPAIEPPSPPPSAPTIGSVVERARFRIGGDRYRDYALTITESRPCFLRGRVETVAGGDRDIDVLVLSPDEFEKFRRSRRYAGIFEERLATEVVLDVPLPGPGQYYFVISNRFSAFTGKQVVVENVRWECGGRGSDSTEAASARAAP